MFVKTPVFRNFSVVSQLWVGRGERGAWEKKGRKGGVEEGSHLPLPLALGQVRDLRISGSRA